MKIYAAAYAQDLMTKMENRLQKNALSSQILRVRTAGTSGNAARVRREDLRERRPVATQAEARWIRVGGEEVCQTNTTIMMHRVDRMIATVDDLEKTTDTDLAMATGSMTETITEEEAEEEGIHIVRLRGKKKDV
jgi:hypothetical protein